MSPSPYILADMVGRGTKMAVSKWCLNNISNTVDQVALVGLVRRWRTKEVVDEDAGVIESQKYTNKIVCHDYSHLRRPIKQNTTQEMK
jgi:hypothetical protein